MLKYHSVTKDVIDAVTPIKTLFALKMTHHTLKNRYVEPHGFDLQKSVHVETRQIYTC